MSVGGSSERRDKKKDRSIAPPPPHSVGVRKDSGELWFVFQIVDGVIDVMEAELVGTNRSLFSFLFICPYLSLAFDDYLSLYFRPSLFSFLFSSPLFLYTCLLTKLSWYVFIIFIFIFCVERLGQNRGHKATQIVLLMLPVLFVVLGFATYMLVMDPAQGGGEENFIKGQGVSGGVASSPDRFEGGGAKRV